MEKNCFFDALGINIKINDEYYAQEIKELFVDFNYYLGVAPTSEARSHRNYHNCMIWETEDFKIFFNYIGTNKNMGCFVETKGYLGCISLINFLDCHGWRWSLTRCDIALDFESTSKFRAFHNLQLDLMDYAKQKNIENIQTVGDWLYEKKGRTLYIGSKQSATQIRLYEKSKEQFEKGNENFPDNIVRLETQFRPTKLQRKHINSLCPIKILRMNRNLVDLYSKYFNDSIEPIRISRPEKKTAKDSLDYVLNQYKRVIFDYIDEVGYYSAIRYLLKKISILIKLHKKN